MKHMILAAAAALALTVAQAQDCKVVGDLAERLMQLRQAGGSLSDIMDSPDFSSLTKRMAVDAFDAVGSHCRA